MSSGFFKRTFASDREEIISGYELRLSQILLEADWGIDSVTHPGAPIFSSTPVHNVFENSDGDCMQEGSYFGETLHPYESVFINPQIWLGDQEVADFDS